jgi:hypothetical protein
VPATGRYLLQATINYSTTTTTDAQLAATINPYFSIERINNPNELVNGVFPIFDVNISGTGTLALRTLLDDGAVTLAGEVALNTGDTIGLFYESDGLVRSLEMGGIEGAGITWSVNRLI